MADGPMKNKGGRPRGSSKHAKPDGEILEKVADLLVKHPHMTATTGMRQILKRVCEAGKDDSTVRRLQKRWRVTGAERLSAARERLRERSSSTYTHNAADITAASRAVAAWDLTGLKAAETHMLQSLYGVSAAYQYEELSGVAARARAILDEGAAGLAPTTIAMREAMREIEIQALGASGAASAAVEAFRREVEMQDRLIDLADPMRRYRHLAGYL